MVKQILGVVDPGSPSVVIKSAETRWLLIKNPRFGDVPSEPEYAWVEEDKVPTTVTTLLRGKGAIIATPEVVAKYGTPPGGGADAIESAMTRCTHSDSASSVTSNDSTPSVSSAAMVSATNSAPTSASSV